MGFVEQLVKKGPAVDSSGCLQPDIGGIDSAVDGDSDGFETLAEQPRIVEVETDQVGNLLLALGAVGRLGAALHGIGDPVELGAVPTVPQSMDVDAFARGGGAGQLVRDHRTGTADAGEPGVFAEAPELDRHFPGAVDFIDRMRNFGVGDVRLVGGVEENDRIVFTGEFHPGGERLAAGHRPGGIVGVAEVDQVDGSVGQGGHEVVFGGDRKIDQALEPSIIGG